MGLLPSFSREVAPNPFYRARALAHEVPISTVRDNCYLLTDYSFVAVYRVQGMLFELAGPEEMEAFESRLRLVLNSLSQGVQIKFLHRIGHNYRKLLDEHLTLHDSENVLARYVAWDQARLFYRLMKERRVLRSENYIVLTHKPGGDWTSVFKDPKTLVEAFLGFMDSGGSKIVQKTLRQYKIELDKFNALIRPVEQALNSADLKPERLNDQELYELAWETLNPRASLSQPCPKIQMPDPDEPFLGKFATKGGKTVANKHPHVTLVAPQPERAQLVSSDWVVRPKYVRIDNTLYGAIALKMLPRTVTAGMAVKLAALPYECTISLEALALNKAKEAEKMFSMARRAIGQADAGSFLGGMADPTAKKAAEEVMARYEQMVAGFESPFMFRLTIIVAASSEEELDSRMDAVQGMLREMNDLQSYQEHWGAHVALKSTWPFALISHANAKKAMTSELSCLIPMFSRWEGSQRPVTIAMDRLGRLVKHDPHVVELPARNRLVTGATGQGKSFAIQLLDEQPFAALKGTEVITIESGGSMEFTTRAFDGVNVKLGPGCPYSFNAFDLPQGFSTLPKKDQDDQLRYKFSFLKNLILCIAKIPNAEDERVAESVIGSVLDSLYLKVAEPTFGDFYRLLLEYSNPEDAAAEVVARKIRTFIRPYVVDENGRPGMYSQYFDVKTNFNVEASFLTFDLMMIKEDPGLLEPMSLLVISGLIYNRLMRRDKARFIVIDEAWALLKRTDDGRESPASKALALFFREGRKLNAGTTLITQNYSDITNDESSRALVGNATVLYYLFHKTSEENTAAFRGAGFNRQVIDLIYGLRTVYGKYSEMMVQEGNAMGVIRIPSTPFKYWLASTNPPDIELRARYERWAEGYGLELPVVIGLLAKDYPAGAKGPHGEEMGEQQKLLYADRFRDHLARFAEKIKAGEKVSFDFQ